MNNLLSSFVTDQFVLLSFSVNPQSNDQDWRVSGQPLPILSLLLLNCLFSVFVLGGATWPGSAETADNLCWHWFQLRHHYHHHHHVVDLCCLYFLCCYISVTVSDICTCLISFAFKSLPVHCVPLLTPASFGFQHERKSSKGSVLSPISALSLGTNSPTFYPRREAGDV